MSSKIELYINTVKYLKPSQLYYRLINRTKRELYRRNIINISIHSELEVNDTFNYLIPELDFDQDYLSRFNVEDILNNQFTFINITNQVDLSEAWNDRKLQHLWRYNLHYFEYLFKLAEEYIKNNKETKYYNNYKFLLENWIDNNPVAFGDGWHPYTVSLRLANWISVYPVFFDRINVDINFNKRIRESMYLQYKYLQKNLEKDVLGNHYFENIKALIIGSIFFGDDSIKNKFKRELLAQLSEQIFEDGMHFELSPMYHKIILEDLIKMTYWLKDDEIFNHLVDYVQKMADVVYSLEENFGKTPAFNDSTDGVSKNYNTLINACEKYFNLKPRLVRCLEDSGFYIIEDQSKKLIFDVGEICPSYLPAHGHCDALSFELSVNSIPLIVNSGVYCYEGGRWRDYFRSTRAHNTVMISGREQSQYWSSFRVAKRIKNVRRKKFKYQGVHFYAGAYVSFNGDEHKRFIGFVDESTIIVLDYIITVAEGSIKSYLHFNPKVQLSIEDDTIHAISREDRIKINTIGTSKTDIEKGWYSEQFNVKKENKCLVFIRDDSRNFFGYLIKLSSSNYKICELNGELRLIGDNELVINCNELGEML